VTVVRLSSEEIEFAAVAGALRQARAVAAGIPEKYGRRDDPWGIHIEGVAAELAVAKLIDRFWIPALHVQSSQERDVGSFEVRSTTHADGCLLLHKADPDDAYFVLVRGSMPTLDVVGWVKAGTVKLREFWRGVPGRECYFVPAEKCHPFTERAA
jgi:hypothetical protein